MLRWLLPTLLLTLAGAPFGLQDHPQAEQARWQSAVQLAVPVPLSGEPAPMLSSAGPTSPALALVAGRVPDDAGLNAAAGRPWVDLDLSKDQIDPNESFNIRVTGRSDGDGGVAAIWWWATGTSDPELHNIHMHNCGGASTCSSMWQVGTNDGWSAIWIHARARDRYGRDADEISREIWVR